MTGERPTTRRRALRAVGAVGSMAVGVAVAGCTDGGDGGDTTVEMNDDLAYVPETISVSTGETVTWENVGNLAHSVTGYDDGIPEGGTYFASGGADSEEQARSTYPDQGEIGPEETYEHSFEAAGTYEYFCIPHENAGMEGTVEVSEE